MYDVQVCINGWVTNLPTNVPWTVGQEISIRVGADEWVGEVMACKSTLDDPNEGPVTSPGYDHAAGYHD